MLREYRNGAAAYGAKKHQEHPLTVEGPSNNPRKDNKGYEPDPRTVKTQPRGHSRGRKTLAKAETSRIAYENIEDRTGHKSTLKFAGSTYAKVSIRGFTLLICLDNFGDDDGGDCAKQSLPNRTYTQI